MERERPLSNSENGVPSILATNHLVAAILLVDNVLTAMCGMHQLEISHDTRVRFLGSAEEFFKREYQGAFKKTFRGILSTGGEFGILSKSKD